ncbi:DNA-binding protein [Clostridium sp. AF18-27]|uniref:helix-turn-helix domain-containing protein n=1 Tax=Enterocloster lavalensis TaxID=460384 RepID=UPI000E4E960F|nr:helix-turn-helix domain-containing protein [Enterocloster lavalensis]RHR54484.1 DNA-binding protein [Clostridium sp. AF18-27]
MLFDDYGDLLNLNDVCTILDIRPATAARLCRNGEIKAFKAGREWRITRLALENYIFSASCYSP